jgi:hypothetical protein
VTSRAGLSIGHQGLGVTRAGGSEGADEISVEKIWGTISTDDEKCHEYFCRTG